MKDNLPLPQDKKLNVLFRVEAGSLGIEGEKHVEPFCKFAEKGLISLDSDYIHWEIVPRHDKSLPEMEFKVNGKKLSHDKAAKYLEVFAQDLDEFELHLAGNLSRLIGEYLGR
ncbi:MAG: hypothetical protein GY814_20625 [Gammaproteobacteria bacterium]|nr:hypothetical protein [Gammaproteobacteria bacterium]